MLKKIRICDVCGKEMFAHATTYKFQKRWFTIYGENIKVGEMCRACYSDFMVFVIQKRRADNG